MTVFNLIPRILHIIISCVSSFLGSCSLCGSALSWCMRWETCLMFNNNYTNDHVTYKVLINHKH